MTTTKSNKVIQNCFEISMLLLLKPLPLWNLYFQYEKNNLYMSLRGSLTTKLLISSLHNLTQNKHHNIIIYIDIFLGKINNVIYYTLVCICCIWSSSKLRYAFFYNVDYQIIFFRQNALFQYCLWTDRLVDLFRRYLFPKNVLINNMFNILQTDRYCESQRSFLKNVHIYIIKYYLITDFRFY